MPTQCIVCNGTVFKPLYAGILRCQQCGYVFADLGLTDDELFGLYGDQYFRGSEYKDYLADQKILQKNFELRLRTLRLFLEARHKHLFEIGSAYGFFLDVVRNRFDSVRGIDVNEQGTRYARERFGLDIMQGDFLQQDFGSQKFDVVCLWDTIEHLRAPHLYLQKISSHTESGALIAITTGDIESPVARLRKQKWRLIHPPTHAHYFSANTLTRMLDRYGFDVIYNRHCGFYRSADAAVYGILVLRHGKQQAYELLQRSGFVNFDFYLNLYDIMYVIARRR